MSKKKPPKDSPKSEVGVLVPQAHPDGRRGAIWQGPAPNPFRGGGRPKNELRRVLTTLSEDSVPMLANVIDGQVVKRARVPLATVLKHARCATCDGKLQPLRPDQVAMIEIEGWESASPSDRIKAAGLAMQFGVGIEKGYDETLVGALARATADVFAGDARLVALHDAWVEVIGDFVRGVDSSKGGEG